MNDSFFLQRFRKVKFLICAYNILLYHYCVDRLVTCIRIAVTVHIGSVFTVYRTSGHHNIFTVVRGNIRDVKSMSGIHNDRSLRGSAFPVYEGLLSYVLYARRTRTFLCTMYTYIIAVLYKMCSDRISFKNPSQMLYTRFIYTGAHNFLKNV